MEPIYHERLASLCNLSTSRFHTIFKKLTGMAPISYLQHMRLRKARTLLLNSGSQIKKVAFEVGYADEFHFSRQFQKYFGCSPSKMRLVARHYSM